jgi:ABC-2 type transport system permease protein
MTTLARSPAPALLPVTTAAPRFGARFALSWRLMRRGALLIWVTAAAYMAIEVVVFRNAYPDEASRQRLLELSKSTIVRMMQGLPSGADTAGGFAVWDGGWMLMIIVSCWALLTTTRLTRGEEDSGRGDLVLCRPVTARQALTTHLATMATASVGVGIAAGLPFIALGEPLVGAFLWGCGLGTLCAVAAALGALVAQIAEPRRRAASVGLGLLAVAFVLRLVANTTDHRIWLLTVAPFGWVERLRAFSGNDWVWIFAPLAAVLVLSAAALAICGRRDSGTALLRSASTHQSTFRLLGSASSFGWRLGSGALLAWTLAFGVIAFLFGLMTSALVDFINQDNTYRQMLESMGMDMSAPAPATGYLSYIAVFLALPFAAFLGWRIGAARLEEAEGRLDNLMVRGVVRWRWLTVTTLYASLAATVLVTVAATALWAGTQLVGAPVSTLQVMEPMAGTLPLVALFTGVAVLTFGLAPRLTVVVPVTLAVLGYLLDSFGTALHWPLAVVGLSPFHHLARLPGSPMTATAVLMMTTLGVAAAAAGIAVFARRDLRGA